jgi:nicotinamidase-related amidase
MSGCGENRYVGASSTREGGEMTTAFDPATGALVIVDMQEYFVRPGSAFDRVVEASSPEDRTWYQHRLAQHVIPNTARLLSDFRERGAVVAFTEFGSEAEDGSDLPLWARRHNEIAVQLIGTRCYLPLSDPASRVIAELAPQEGELVITKNTSGPLAGTRLPGILRERGITAAVVVGVATNVCVQGMARELADSDFDVYVCGDACATIGEAFHEAALSSLAVVFAQVVSTEDAPRPLVRPPQPVEQLSPTPSQ